MCVCTCTHSLTQGNLNLSVSQYSLLFLSETLKSLASQEPQPECGRCPFVLQRVRESWAFLSLRAGVCSAGSINVTFFTERQRDKRVRSSFGFEEISYENRNELKCINVRPNSEIENSKIWVSWVVSVSCSSSCPGPAPCLSSSGNITLHLQHKISTGFSTLLLIFPS